jgi:hypothetical protein
VHACIASPNGFSRTLPSTLASRPHFQGICSIGSYQGKVRENPLILVENFEGSSAMSIATHVIGNTLVLARFMINVDSKKSTMANGELVLIRALSENYYLCSKI